MNRKKNQKKQDSATLVLTIAYVEKIHGSNRTKSHSEDLLVKLQSTSLHDYKQNEGQMLRYSAANDTWHEREAEESTGVGDAAVVAVAEVKAMSKNKVQKLVIGDQTR